MKLKITLLSDLCSGSGDVYNSFVDTDVVYDDYGFPYLPAKRIKGCLREACLELVEFGAVSQEEYEGLFGREGNQFSRFSLENAYPENYDAMLADVRKADDSVLTHPQRVLGLYTYTRTQTAMTAEGAAQKNSLRTIRVVKKGMVFEAKLFLDGEEKEEQLLKKAAGMVRHIGIGRTRGLGLVQIEVVSEKEELKIEAGRPEFTADRYRIDYSVRLLAPVLLKSPEGNQAKSQKYIEGSKVLGMLAGIMGQEAYKELMGEGGREGNELIISNAYVARETASQSRREVRRCTPVRASLQKEKDKTYDEKKQMQVEDMLLIDEPSEEQMTPVGELYADREGYVAEIETEINYHHRRPSDKSIGRADGNGDSAFYQLESIRKGQIFAGYILAGREQAEKVYDALSKSPNARMGQGRRAEYGAVRLNVEDVSPVSTEQTKAQSVELVHDFFLKLNAPAILYNEFGAVSAEPEILQDYLTELLKEKKPDLELKKTFLRFETVGGFNVTWNRRKPVFTALGKGTICLFHTEKGVDINQLKNLFLGERVSEGYGEIEAGKVENEAVILRKAEDPSIERASEKAVYETDIIERLHREQEKLRIEADARKNADKINGEDINVREIDAVLGKMILLGKTEDSQEKMKNEIEGIESPAKQKLALILFGPIESYVKKGGKIFDEKETYQIYSRAYLNQLKYRFRPGREERRKQHD